MSLLNPRTTSVGEAEKDKVLWFSYVCLLRGCGLGTNVSKLSFQFFD